MLEASIFRCGFINLIITKSTKAWISYGYSSEIVQIFNTIRVAATVNGDYLVVLDFYDNGIKRARKEINSEDIAIAESAKGTLVQTFINKGILY